MAVVLIKLARRTQVDGRDRLVSKGREWFIADTSRDWNTEFGVVPKEILQEEGKHTIGKDEYCVLKASYRDKREHLGQDAQRIVEKDLGHILARTGLNNKSVLGEAGSGSGGATTFFAQIVDKVISFDVKESAKKRVRRGLDLLGIENVELSIKDVAAEDFSCEDVDAFLLDVPEPWLAWKNMSCVKVGGYVIGYTPNANQLQKLENEAPNNFRLEHSCEMIERHWSVKGRVCRPATADFSHTAFLSFYRRLY